MATPRNNQPAKPNAAVQAAAAGNQAAVQPAAVQAPVAPVEQKKVTSQLGAMHPPELLTGGSIANWKVDFENAVSSVAVKYLDAAGKEQTVVIHGEGAKAIPVVQKNALFWLVLSFITNPSADRGAGYRECVAEHADIIEKELGKYTLMINLGEKKALKGLVCTVKDVLAAARLYSTILDKSQDAYGVRGKKVKARSTKEEQVELVL